MNLINSFKKDKEKTKIRSDEELNARKNEFLTLCHILDELEIKYFLLGGILLGAIRNKGFIPWDWDVEICVYSNDVSNKFDNLYLKILASKFTILTIFLSSGLVLFSALFLIIVETLDLAEIVVSPTPAV